MKKSLIGSQKHLKDVKKKSKIKNKIKLLKKQKIHIDVEGNAEFAGKRSKTKIKKGKAAIFLGDEKNIEERERNLTSLLFCDKGPLNTGLDDVSSLHDVSDTEKSAPVENYEHENHKDFYEISDTVKRKAVWTDEDDHHIKVKDVMATMTRARGTRGPREMSDVNYKETLEEKFSEVFGSSPHWARLDRKLVSDEHEEESNIRMKIGSYLASSQSLTNLPKTRLHFSLLRNLNDDSLREGRCIKAIEFAQDISVVLVAGFSGDYFGAVTLFRFDGKHNVKIKSILFPNYPILCAKFLPKKYQFVVGSHRSGCFYVCDIKTGKKTRIPWSEHRNAMKKFEVSPDGKYIAFVGRREILFFDCDTVGLLETLCVPCEVNAIAFHPEAPTLYAFGDNGQVYMFNLCTWCCFHSFFDDGCIEGTALDVSPNGRFLACGSLSGIVNVYDASILCASKTPIPLKVFNVLVTGITALAFNPTSEILAIASFHRENAIRLIHTGSLSLYANFPGNHTFKRIQTITFTPDSKYLALGSNNKVAHLCKLLHY